GEERLFVETIRPRPEERNAGEPGTGPELRDRTVREPQDLLALDRHREGDVADRRYDRYDGPRLSIFEPDNAVLLADRVPLRGDGCGAHDRETEDCGYGEDRDCSPRGSVHSGRAKLKIVLPAEM